MVVQLPDREQISTWSETEFARLNPKDDQPLCLPGFETGEFDGVYKEALSYVRSLLKGALRDEVGSPIFHFVVEEDMAQLSEGGRKWVGIIPREIDAASAQYFAEHAAQKLTLSERKRLKLKGENVNKLRSLIQNTLSSILHYNLKAANHVPALNIALNGEKNFISHKELEEKVSLINESGEAIEVGQGREVSKAEYDRMLKQLLRELGTLPEEAGAEASSKAIEVLIEAKNDAWLLYKRLGDNIEKAQAKAGIPGAIAEVDVNGDHSSLHFIEHLRAMYGLSKEHGKSIEDRYELQTAAHLTWLMARLITHPVYKTLVENKDAVIHDFMNKVYHKGNLFKKSDERKLIFLDKRKRKTSPGVAHYTWDPEVYDSQLEGFDDLNQGQKQVYRGEFRPKEKLSILVKAIKERQELSKISDALAGEAVMMGIEEKDLDPKVNSKAERLQELMHEQAKAIAASMGLKEAPKGVSYKKIPRGSYAVVPKLSQDTGNTHTFNFPAVKIYFNVPVGDNPDSPEGESIRTEYRLICQDTWLRANKQSDSMSHNEMYKMKQGVDLLDVLTARAYNDTIHPVASQFRKWTKRNEAKELKELKKTA